MEYLPALQKLLTDDRLGANLIAIHGVITFAVLGSLILRRACLRGSGLFRRTGVAWLQVAGEEALRRGRVILLWLTLSAVFTAIVGGSIYHVAGRDIRVDLRIWYQRLTIGDLWEAGLTCGKILAILLVAWLAIRLVRFIVPILEARLRDLLEWHGGDGSFGRWFLLLHFYSVISIRLASIWAICKTVGLGEFADIVIGFAVRILSIIVVARLLTLSCHVISQTLSDLSEGYLGTGPFRLYWERVRRLFPFGERCFEAAVYVMAASLCVRQLHFIDVIADLGPSVVQCIGIFFTTRVLIELLQVLLGEAFGIFKENHPVDQKAQTLVPLLYSISQYVLYFGSALIMLGVLGIDTKPILAGVGILGLAVGLGAQSLVTDVVLGFFILFENQYLVGDYVALGTAAGTIEMVGIRVTHLRDDEGKLHLIPNGQIKGVISYSKGYVNAVVDLEVPTGTDLESVFRAMTEAGKRLRQLHREVLADTVVQGLVELGTKEMTIRAVTRVRPGAHEAMQNRYRQLLRQILDEQLKLHQPDAA